MNWTWKLHDVEGSPTIPTELDIPVFTSQADAETWIGESWAELITLGVESATLLNDESVVYGPMSLRPA